MTVGGRVADYPRARPRNAAFYFETMRSLRHPQTFASGGFGPTIAAISSNAVAGRTSVGSWLVPWFRLSTSPWR